jgi:hypothetical protein
MVVIAKSNEREFGFNQFIKDIVRKTQEAIRNKQVLTHCILIYSRANPIVSKILSTNLFYEALDEITGRYINIYHADSTPKAKPSKINEQATTTFGYMDKLNHLNIYTDREQNRDIIEQMKKQFSINLDNHNPILFFFHLDGEIINGNMCLEFEEGDEASTFKELKNIVLTVVSAVRNVTDDNTGNQFDIFNLAQDKLKTYKMVKRLQKVAASPLLNVALALK